MTVSEARAALSSTFPRPRSAHNSSGHFARILPNFRPLLKDQDQPMPETHTSVRREELPNSNSKSNTTWPSPVTFRVPVSVFDAKTMLDVTPKPRKKTKARNAARIQKPKVVPCAYHRMRKEKVRKALLLAWHNLADCNSVHAMRTNTSRVCI
jgi:hypothetical protein